MKIIIDGNKLEADGQKTILETAREFDIPIPSLCDHPGLTPFTGCRLCLVEIKGRRGFVPACSTYPEEGMEVKTQSATLRAMRKQILGLILSEHPDACLICSEKANCDEYKSTIRKVGEVTGCVLCPNNGRCELQDVVEAVGIERVEFPSVYRDSEIRRDDPFFERNYNLCILCGRCVRVCDELRGASTITFVYRGSRAVIGTALDRPLHESGCQFCGACVDVCPTGSLTEKAVKYEPLPDAEAKTVCPLCSMGCELEVQLNRGRILSARPAEDGAANKGQACVKGRFIIKDVVYSPRRILQPMIRKNKELEEVTWEEALGYAAQRLRGYKGKEIGLIASSQVSCEDHYVAEKFAAAALRTRNTGAAVGTVPWEALSLLAQKRGMESRFNFRMEEISQADVIFLAAADLSVSHPILWLEVVKAVRNGANLVMLSPRESAGSRFASLWLPARPGSEDLLFRSLSRLIEEEEGSGGKDIEGYEAFRKGLQRFDLLDASEATGVAEGSLRETAELLMKGKPCFIFGAPMASYAGAVPDLTGLWNLSLQTGGRIIPLGGENNARGFFELHRNVSNKGLSWDRILQQTKDGEIKALYSIGPFPPDREIKADFLLVQDCCTSEMMKRADVVFPAATFAESAGTFVNAEGRFLSFSEVIEPRGEAKPDWWILSRLAGKLGKTGFDYRRSSDILKEIKKTIPAFSKVRLSRGKKGSCGFVFEKKGAKQRYLAFKSLKPEPRVSKRYPFVLVTNYNLDYYRGLSLSEEVKGLRMLRDPRWLGLNPEDARSLGMKEGEKIEAVSPFGKIQAVAKIVESLRPGIVEASFLWSEDSLFSTVRLRSAGDSLWPVRVNIRRGK
jgi:formate dehydrogenase alpha subunit